MTRNGKKYLVTVSIRERKSNDMIESFSALVWKRWSIFSNNSNDYFHRIQYTYHIKNSKCRIYFATEKAVRNDLQATWNKIFDHSLDFNQLCHLKHFISILFEARMVKSRPFHLLKSICNYMAIIWLGHA